MNDKRELSVSRIPATVFIIPHYQRGYRWTNKEVTALLDDFLAFAQNSTQEEPYCLQPLVLQKLDEGELNVVDGQQRLTTIAIILHELEIKHIWDIKYTAEGGMLLSQLLEAPGNSINDFFRNQARAAVQNWLRQDNSRKEALCELINGNGNKRVIFLLYEIEASEDGHAVFQRLNAGKTPLTSSELIRALYMEAGNGLSDSEKADIAKEWDLIEAEMGNDEFWAIWKKQDFRDVPTRMDFLFSIVTDVDSQKARQDGLLVYRKMETLAKEKELRAMWEMTLRCWWWMQSCFADDEAYHLLGWLVLFSERGTRGLWDIWQKKGCRMDAFKKELRQLVANGIVERDFDSFRYNLASTDDLRGFFVLLNALEAQRQHIRFRFDLYEQYRWDIEHIASQTDNPLTDKDEQEQWLALAQKEMTKSDLDLLNERKSFAEKWSFVFNLFEKKDDKDRIVDKDGIENLALLDAGTNRAYKNAIFPAKRRWILKESLNNGKYIPPLTEAVFAKLYSTSAAQMRYWGKDDAVNYRETMKQTFDQFMRGAK
ncbi:MAG: DUF262 domain-containing protein [Victivallales bacterium]|nr:DUF262 domain-containing protein [Victivallales bacterium]